MPGPDLPFNAAAAHLIDELSRHNAEDQEACLEGIYAEIQAIKVAEPLSEKYIPKIQETLQAKGVGLEQNTVLINHAAGSERPFNLLSFAIKVNHIPLIKLLIEVGFEKNALTVEPPLITAIIDGGLDAFKALVQQGCRCEMLLDKAIQLRDDDITQWLFDNRKYHGAELEFAVSVANEFAVQLLHTKSYAYTPDDSLPQNIRESCCPILYFAIAKGYSEGLRLLLNTGKYDELNTADETLGTPLDYAIACKQKECVTVLKAHLMLPTEDSKSDDGIADTADIYNSDDEDPTPPAPPQSSFQLKFLYTCATLSSAALIAGIITLCLFSPIGTGIAIAAVGATALILSAVGLYKHSHKAQNTEDKKPGLAL